MPESGGFPVRRDRIAELATDLETLRLDARRTNDPYKHAKIGLADPAEGGNGVLIEIIGPDDGIDTAMIAGRKAGRIYVRSPDDAQTYRTAGTLPPFYNRRSWLDFDIIDVEPAAISAIRLQDAASDTLYLRRAPGDTSRDFKPAPPYTDFQVIDPIAISSTALAITRLSPLDAKPAETLSSQPVARHISETFDGLEINLQAYREADGLWVTLRAVEAGEGARRAQAINEKAEGWAFRLRGFDWQDFTPTVFDIAAPVTPED